MQAIWTDPHTGLKTLQTDLVTDRGVSWEAAARKLEHERMAPDDRSGFMISRRPIFGRTMVILALQKTPKGNIFDICRPNTGPSFFDMEASISTLTSTAINYELHHYKIGCIDTDGKPQLRCQCSICLILNRYAQAASAYLSLHAFMIAEHMQNRVIE